MAAKSEPIISVVPNDEGKEKFKKSENVAFYRRQIQGPNLKYRLLLDSLVLTEKGAHFELLEDGTKTRLLLSLTPCKNDTVRIVIDEIRPIKTRYRVPDVLTGEPPSEQLTVESKTKDSVTLSWSLGRYQVRMWHFPFRLEVLCDQEVIVTFNSKDKLWFESLQDKPSKLEEDKNSLWRETFRNFEDVKANGPSSLGADFCLHGFQHVYGLPQHADRLQLRDTSEGEPYRLYNLDVFAADLYCRLGLYGSVPLIVAHKPDRTVGVFWLNASDTFINIQYSPSDPRDSETPPVKRRRLRPQTDVHWLSESGVIDCTILLGPAPRQLFQQYAQLTGYQAMPPLFSLGYHQCRWNYKDEADVKDVDAGFDRHEIPYDVIWLDIEHTDGKRYFTWDPALFPKPAALQQHLSLRLNFADARKQAAHAEGLLLAQLLQGPLQVLHQPAGGDAALPPEPRRVRHRAFHVRATPGGGVHPESLLVQCVPPQGPSKHLTGTEMEPSDSASWML